MTNINVGMSEVQISKTPGTVLVAPGLGSCIALAMYDPINKIAGMAHVVLPDSSITRGDIIPCKYADTAVPELLNMMIQAGAKKHSLIIKAAGGAQMFNIEQGSNILNIGLRNIIAIKAALSKEGLNATSVDTGGNRGRTVRLEVTTGSVFVKIIGQQELEL